MPNPQKETLEKQARSSAPGCFVAFSVALLAGLFLLYGKLGRTWRGVAELRVLFKQSPRASGRRSRPVRRHGNRARQECPDCAHQRRNPQEPARTLQARRPQSSPCSTPTASTSTASPLPEVKRRPPPHYIAGRVMILASFDGPHRTRRAPPAATTTPTRSAPAGSATVPIAIETGKGKTRPAASRHGLRRHQLRFWSRTSAKNLAPDRRDHAGHGPTIVGGDARPKPPSAINCGTSKASPPTSTPRPNPCWSASPAFWTKSISASDRAARTWTT